MARTVVEALILRLLLCENIKYPKLYKHQNSNFFDVKNCHRYKRTALALRGVRGVIKEERD